MKNIFLFIFCILCFNFLHGQPDIKKDWKAFWIGEKQASVPNTFQCYRHAFSLNKIPKNAIADIATDSKYWLYINGKLVVFEGQLKRGPTPNDTYYDEVQIQPFLKKGNNSIAILVWYWGKEGFCHKSSGKMGLLFEARLDNNLIVSGNRWKTAAHKAFLNSQSYTPTKPQPNFRLPEFNIRYDARLGNENWIAGDFDDSKWKTADVIGHAGAAPWNALWKRPIPLWYDGGLVPYQNTVSIKNGDTVVYMALPKNITITPYFKIDAPAGKLIDVRTDNYMGGNAPNVRTEYVTKSGIQEFETPAFMNGHQVIYTFAKGIKILELKYRETKYNTEQEGYFTSSDTFLNRLWQKSATTLNVNMRDGIQDSPDRERAQWWGDVAIVLEEIFYTCDARGVSAIKKAISNLMEWQKADSVLFSPVPAGNWDKELPAQMLAAVGKYGIGKYIELSGDTAMARYCYPHIKKYLKLWHLNEQGLVQHRDGGWSWQDWGDKIDEPLLDNAWYYMALENANRMAIFLQEKTDAAQYAQQMHSIKENFEKYFWKQDHFASDGYKFYADDRANGLAVCAGFVSGQQWKLLRPMLDTTFHAGPYLEKYILESYFIMNDAEAGLARMKTRYRQMVNSGLSTLWEGWDIGSDTYGGGTYNHGWTGGPLSLMSGYVAGIKPLAAGYKSYSIKPQLGGLQSLSCGTSTANGFIKLTINTDANKLAMQVQTIDAEGTIAIPKIKNKYNAVLINGSRVNQYFIYAHEDESYLYYTCTLGGVWNISCE